MIIHRRRGVARNALRKNNTATTGVMYNAPQIMILVKTREYIITNSLNWEADENYKG